MVAKNSRWGTSSLCFGCQWVDVDNVAEVAALTLAFPELHAGKTYRLGYDAKILVR
jgi:uncharacterized protein YbjT (DUF2867 family)